jgi:hypothetical protein
LQFKISSSENQSYKKHKKGRERKKDMRAVWKVRGLAAVRFCYAEGGDDYYAKL